MTTRTTTSTSADPLGIAGAATRRREKHPPPEGRSSSYDVEQHHVRIVSEVRAEKGKDASLGGLSVGYTTSAGEECTVTTNGSLHVAAAVCS